jgi:hypothetical protein
MSVTLTQITEALAESLRTIDGLRVYDVQPDSFATPCAIVNVDSIDYHGAFQMGLIETSFKVMVIVSRADTRNAVHALDDYLSPQGNLSVRRAIESDVTLGGVVASAFVTRASAFQSITVGDANYLGVELDVETKH